MVVCLIKVCALNPFDFDAEGGAHLLMKQAKQWQHSCRYASHRTRPSNTAHQPPVAHLLSRGNYTGERRVRQMRHSLTARVRRTSL
jgi:hypothetical protein